MGTTVVMLGALLSLFATPAGAPLAPNMNGDYAIANPRASAAAKGTPHAGGFSTDWRAYPSAPENPVRSFDVYSPPIRTQYSQVFWTMMGNVPLPEDLVREFDGKAIAVLGYESDQGEAAAVPSSSLLLRACVRFDR